MQGTRAKGYRTAVKGCLTVSLLLCSTMVIAQNDYNLPEVDFASTQVCVGEHPQALTVELADSFQQRARGLMARTELGEHEGMWFRYNQQRPGSNGFWMYQTLLPLDIAYLDGWQRVVKIMTMEPCPHSQASMCQSYRPGVPYYGALEMNAGYFAEHNIQVGDKLREADDGNCATTD